MAQTTVTKDLTVNASTTQVPAILICYYNSDDAGVEINGDHIVSNGMEYSFTHGTTITINGWSESSVRAFTGFTISGNCTYSTLSYYRVQITLYSGTTYVSANTELKNYDSCSCSC